MIEKTILDYLASKIDVPVRAEITDDLKGRYIILEKTGGTEEDKVKSSTIVVQSHADSLFEAAELNETVLSVMSDSVIIPEISKCSVNSNYNFTNLATKKYRYQAVFDLVHF